MMVKTSQSKYSKPKSQYLPHCAARRYYTIPAVILIFLTLGILWSNVLLIRLAGYPVTPSLPLISILFLFGLLNLLSKRRPPRTTLALLPLPLIIYEFVIHGIIMGHVTNREWLQSFVLLVMCVGLLIFSSKLRIYNYQLSTLSKIVSYLAYSMGGIGLVQVILSVATGFVWTPVPALLSLRDMSIVNILETKRFSGMVRAYGLAYERSYYGTGMVVLATLCLTLLFLDPPQHKARFFRWGALLVALGAVVVSVSFAAWGLITVVLLTWMMSRIKIRGLIIKIRSFGTRYQRKIIRRLALLGVVLITFFIFRSWPYIQPRFEKILQGSDASANLRVLMSINLILAPGEDIPSSLLGTGIGLQEHSSRRKTEYEKYGRHQQVVLWNGYAYVAITMGWIGLALQGLIIAGVLCQKNRLPIPTLHLDALVLFYLFAHGGYLSPEWWTLLILVAILKGLYVLDKRNVFSLSEAKV